MTEREQIEQAIAALEAQRAILGDAVVEVALGPLQRQLGELTDAKVQPELFREGERKLVTVMFADISGFTPLAEHMDPETLRDLINNCFDLLVPSIEKYGGTVVQFAGDLVMSMFGAPFAGENDAEHAVWAALEMMDVMSAINAEQDVELGMHIGINTGLVIAGDMGSGARQHYGVMGDAVNLAARLEDLSEQGEILVGPDTYRLTAPLFTFETQEPVRVKGKAEPVAIYRLVGPKAEPGYMRGLETQGISSPLVGRDAEVAIIKECIDRLRTGQGGILAIIGEAGVGKSRLMAEIHSAVDTSRLTWLEGRTLSFGQTISYWPFQQILWQFAGITEDDSEAEAWHKLENRVSALFGKETPEILPYLAILLTLEVRGEYIERVKYLDGEAMGHQIFVASRRIFERLASTQPTVLIFEDLHWMDESSAVLLQHLLPLVERGALLIIGLSRPYRETPATRLQIAASQDFPDGYREIQLTPLSRADSAQLVRNLLTIEDLPSQMREMIVHKAEGNPFFLEEIIRTLIDTGAVMHEPATGRWRATAQIETITIPDTIQGVIMARVDRLDGQVKQVLCTAAVVGRSFLYRVLRAVEEVDQQLDNHLVELQTIQLIREKQRLPEIEYIFKHALAQEAIYETILVQKRRELHQRVGQAIEMLFADRLEEFYGLLAYHYARAETWEKAQEYLLKAGDQAGRVAADVEALTHYRQAMVAYARAFGDRWDSLQRAALERKMGEALLRRGEHAQARGYMERALGYLGKPLPGSRWKVRLAILHEIVQQIAHRLLPRFFINLTNDPVSPAMEEEHRLMELTGWMDMMVNTERFLLLALRQLNTAERSGFPYGVAVGATILGGIADFISLSWLAESYHLRAMAHAEVAQHPRALASAYYGLTVHKVCSGEWDAVIEYCRKAVAICQEIGELRLWGGPMEWLVVGLAQQGHLNQALKLCREMVRLGQEGSDLQVQCWGRYMQGHCLQRLGLLDEAISNLQEAVKLAEAIPDYMTRVGAGGILGRCFLRQGALEQGLDILRSSQQVYAEYGAAWGNDSELYKGLIEAYLVAAEQSEGAERTDWLKKTKHACRDALKQGKTHRSVVPEVMRLRGTYEWLRGKTPAARKWWQRSLGLAEEMGQRYDLGITHLEMGQRLGERIHLEHAEAILTEIGAEWDLARAREALENASQA